MRHLLLETTASLPKNQVRESCKHVALADPSLALDSPSHTSIVAAELGRKGIRIDAVAPCTVVGALARAVYIKDSRTHARSPQGLSSASMVDL